MIISYSDLGSVNMHDLLLAKSNLSLFDITFDQRYASEHVTVFND